MERASILRAMNPIHLVPFLAGMTLATAQTPVPSPVVWQMQDSGTTAGLRGIHTVDGTVAWASGTGGTVLRTTDGGAHWTKCAVPDAAKDGSTLDFRGVQAWDGDTAIVMASGPGEKSRLYKTTDGCNTWKLVFMNPDKDGFWDAFSVADNNNLMVLGDPVGSEFTVLSTADGGTTWEKIHDNGLRSNAKEGAFAASNSSLVVLWDDGVSAFGTGSTSGARLFYECDPCTRKAMWTSSALPMFSKGTVAGIFAIEYRDWRHWLAVGGNYTKPNEPTGIAARSSDGGLTWTASTTQPHGFRSAVQWGESLQAWITVGTNGSDISRDDGNWNALSLPFVVGPDGRIARINPAALAPPAVTKGTPAGTEANPSKVK